MSYFSMPDGVPVILASASPRRRELLGAMGIPFTVMTREVEETYPASMHPRDAVRYLAEKKGRAVIPFAPGDALIISSDTLVEVGGVPLGKPKDKDDAKRMLETLSGRSHYVHTGVSVAYRGRIFSGTDSTEVVFRPLDGEEIDRYIATGEPMDKAGAYGIQGLGGKLVSHTVGHLDTVIGFPCELAEQLLREALRES